MLRPVRTSTPEAVVSLEEIKRHVNAVDFSDDDALLGVLVQAATDHLDGWSGILGRCLISQEWRQDFGCWPRCRNLRLPFPDVGNVIVKFSDADNTEQTVSDTLYEVLGDALGAFVRFTDAFSAPVLFDNRSNAVRITFTAGYGTASDVPSALKVAIMMLAAHWYQNREAVTIGNPVTAIPLAVDALVAPYRLIGV